MKTLAKYHSPLLLTTTPGSGAYILGDTTGFVGFNSGWSDLGVGGQFVSECFFDLTGMSMEDKTIFIDGITVQEAGNTAIAAGAAGDSYVVYDIMTSIPVDFTDPGVQAALVNHGLGFPAARLDFEHVLYQRRRRYSLELDQAAAFPSLVEEEQSGSLMPTASDRIYSYCYMAIYEISGTISGITVAGRRHLISATPKDEPEFQHIMRLKRSYDLQQSQDVD